MFHIATQRFGVHVPHDPTAQISGTYLRITAGFLAVFQLCFGLGGGVSSLLARFIIVAGVAAFTCNVGVLPCCWPCAQLRRLRARSEPEGGAERSASIELPSFGYGATEELINDGV